MQARAVGLAAGFIADRILGDPATGHPVAAFGRFAQDMERRVWADDVLTGAAYTSVLVGGTGAVGAVIARATRGRPRLQVVTTAATTWAVLGGRSLGREAEAVRDHLASGDLPAARRRLTHLVGRDTETLDENEISRAVVESVAENTSDAVVAPLLAGAFGGVPGLVAYRAANTLDAMVGHRSERYVRFGRASARLDDLLNLVPSRLSALLAAALAPFVGGDRKRALEVWRHDAPHHPSPNAGPVEAAFAGALDVRLGGVNTYADRVEDRHTLGVGRPVEPTDITRSVRLADMVGAAALGVAVVIAARPSRRRPAGR
jgi:adenosylcobinamide-phosphate synthase